MNNPLTDFIPARARRWLYAGYAFIVLCEGASAVGYATADIAQPDWLKVVTAITAYVGGGLGLVAASNAGTASKPAISRNESGQSGVVLALLIAILLVVVLFWFGVRP